MVLLRMWHAKIIVENSVPNCAVPRVDKQLGINALGENCFEKDFKLLEVITKAYSVRSPLQFVFRSQHIVDKKT